MKKYEKRMAGVLPKGYSAAMARGQMKAQASSASLEPASPAKLKKRVGSKDSRDSFKVDTTKLVRKLPTVNR